MPKGYIKNCDCSWCNTARKEEFADNYIKTAAYYFFIGFLFGFITIFLIEIFIYFMLTGGG